MIIIKIHGGLCNQLFQWAYGYALSKEHDVYFDTSFFDNQNTMSPVSIRDYELPNIINREIPIVTKEIFEEFSSKSVQMVLDNFYYSNIKFEKNKNYYLNGYWQSELFFNNVKDEIINSFKFPELNDFDFTDSCSIHIRRGDYLKLQGMHTHQTLDYYEKALEVVNPKGKVFVFSDDIKWCEKNLNFKNQIFMKENSNIEDLRYMSLCSNNIMANSSFSWWGSYLNNNPNKIVVCPKNWFGNNTNDSDIKMKDWIQI